MLRRRASLALAALVMLGMGRAVAAATDVFLPTSTILHMAALAARGDGYDLRDRRLYYFDLVRGRDGKPPFAGYVALGFYWQGDLVETIAIDDHSGMVVDTTGCRLLDYPALRTFRRPGLALTPAAAAAQAVTGCDHLAIVRVPKLIGPPRR